ncbi:MAG TPA: hypothetical protein P5279_16925 [Anaerohalosphaeraceae bacterium]|nr:hypothetical protein [Anaerohalosphaeraceae bacterium]HRT52174.1 hypothetical protein [Anaerohalosphaeraceae bacterium]HRT88208.1 hypothetical protein [Anaerohalosphaeraceae bacterium]
MGRKMGVLIVAAAGLLAAGCQEERAYVAADDYMAFVECDSWQKWAESVMVDEYAALTDLSQPGRHPWCEAMDGYYQANGLWHYGKEDWRELYRGRGEYAAGVNGEEVYTSWRYEAAEQLAGHVYPYYDEER